MQRKLPAEKWEEAYPIGNGRLGAMIPGGIYRMDIQMNQDSIWYGCPIDRINKDAKAKLEDIRDLIFDGKISEAEKEIKLSFSSCPESQRPYQSMGTLQCNFDYHTSRNVVRDSYGRIDEITNATETDYELKLDMEYGQVCESFCIDSNRVNRTYFSSYPDNVMAISFESEIMCDYSFCLRRGRYFDHSGKFDDFSVYMDGNLGRGGIDFACALTAAETDGLISVRGDHLCINDAKSLVIYIICETSFYSDDYWSALRNRIEGIRLKSYEEIRRLHYDDYGHLINTVSMKIPEDSFAEEYYQFGRYLCISGSRPGSLPLNLQGIWNDSMEPPWDSKYTININTEMNYWPVDMCGLSECYEPLFDHMLRMLDSGKTVAEQMYGAKGFVAHHNTDIWGDCAPQDIYLPASFWTLGGAWLATHIMMHYEYVKDKEFLARMYPFLKENVLFFHDFLVEHDGLYVLCPSVSPENTYILESGERGCVCYGATMDTEIIRELFNGYLKAASELDIDDSTITKTLEILGKLPDYKIGKHGQLCEWINDYEEIEPGHRHISHLYGLHPARQITLENTPKLAEAAANSLERRLKYGGGHTGWSCAWIVNFYTRLEQGNKAYDNLTRLWKQSTFPNMMDNHPRKQGYAFQIDGNLGAIAAMTEMVIQSYEDKIKILPAIPDKWREGSLTGVRIIGGRADIFWSAGKLERMIIYANEECIKELIYKGKLKTVDLTEGYRIIIDEGLNIISNDY